MAVAASFTSAGTERRPATVLTYRMSSVYAVSGMIAVASDRPKMGRSTANAARLGMV